MARTDTEVYRRFEGELKSLPLRFLPIMHSGLRVAVKKKVPLLLLYGIPTIATIVFSVIVYAKFTLEDQAQSLEPGAAMVAAMAGQMIEVREQIFQFNLFMQFFALLAMAWYGAGLIAEDRRVGAHLLYFSRPITRMDYFVGKFLTAAIFGVFAMLLPGLIICLVATFSSPEWSFIKQEYDVVLNTLLYAGLWILCVTSVVLAVSSLVKRKAYALVGVVGLFAVNQAFSLILADIMDDERYRMVGIPEDMLRIGEHLFDVRNPERLWSLGASVWIVIAVTILSWACVAIRLRRLEVVE